MTAREHWFTASDGKRIAYLRRSSDGAPRAVLVVAHGMNDHSRRFLSLADTVAVLGIEVVIPDLRGHGRTDPDEHRGWLGPSGGVHRVAQDILELGESIALESGGLPLYFFGHSFGGLTGMLLLGLHGSRFSGAILSAPPAKPDPLLDFAGRIVIGNGLRFRGQKGKAHLPRAMTFGAYAKTVPGARTGSDWISRNPQVVDAYVADPDCAFTCSYGFYRDLTAAIRTVYAPGFLRRIPRDLPLYLFGGGADPVIGMKKGFDEQTARFAALGLADFRSRCYEGARHETLNETNADEVRADIAGWLAERLR